jgi:ribosomal protein S18 acetylase RimI-like enzyme
MGDWRGRPQIGEFWGLAALDPGHPTVPRFERPCRITVFRIRPYRNADTPAIVAIWRDQPRQRGLMHPLSSALLEELVLSKPYFDPAGLFLAFQDDTPAGFVHAGFGPSDEGHAIDTQLGVTSMLMVGQRHREGMLATDLLARSEDYLRNRGASVLYAGGIRPLNPFYLGLYGGSESPGVLASDPERLDLYRSQGYREIDRVLVLQRNLASFRPVTDRQQMQLRRRLQFVETPDPPCHCWWDAQTFGRKESLRYAAARAPGEPPVAAATFWNMEPLASSWGMRAAGLWDVHVEESHRRQGLATCLLGDAFKQFTLQGLQMVEAQVMVQNQPAQALYEKLGFIEIDQGVVLRKEV